ncbi:hypothetical protein lerEdw1_011919, partial [Lerista edwardsae]
DVPLMESEKIQGEDPCPQVTYMLNDSCIPALTTGSPEATEFISMSHASEEGVEEEEEEEEEEELAFLFVMDREQIWDSLCNPVEREMPEQLDRGQRDPENETGLSEGERSLNTLGNNSEDLSWNCSQEELTAANSGSAHQPSFFHSFTLTHAPTTPNRVPAGQVQIHELLQLPQALNIHDTSPQTPSEDTLRTNTFLTQEESTYECHQVSHDVSKSHQDAESFKTKSDENHSLELDTRYGKEKGLSGVIEAGEGMSSKMEEADRMEPSPATANEKKGRELKEQREDVKLSTHQPSSEFPEGSRINADGTQTTPNGITSLLSPKDVNNHSDFGEEVEDLGQNVLICSDLQEDSEEGRTRSQMETTSTKSHRDGGELALAQEPLSKTGEFEPAEMEAVELGDTELNEDEDLDWKEMKDDMKMEQEKLLLGHDGQEEQEPLVETEGITFPLKDLFASDSSLESTCGISECCVQTSVAKQMPSARLPAEGLNPASDSNGAQSPTCDDTEQWEYSGIYDQAGCVSCSGQDCEQPTEGGRKRSVEEQGSENAGEGKCVRNVDGEGLAPFGEGLLLTPEPKTRSDFQGMDHPVDGEIHISASSLETITVAGPLQKDDSKEASDGTVDYVVLHEEEPDSIQELLKQDLPLPCQRDKVVCVCNEVVVRSVHEHDTSSRDCPKEAQDSDSEILQQVFPGGGLSNTDESWHQVSTQAQDQGVHYLGKFQKHPKTSVKNFVFPGKEAEEDKLCPGQETSINELPYLLGSEVNRPESDHNTDTLTLPNSGTSIATDVAQLTKTLTPVSGSDQMLAPEPASSHSSQPSSPTLDCRHSVPFSTSPPSGDFLALPPDPNIDLTHPSQILEVPSSSQTCQFLGLKSVSTEIPPTTATALAKEVLDQPPASESDFPQHCQLPDHMCNSKLSLSLEEDDHQPIPMPILPPKHKHFVFPALNTNQAKQIQSSSFQTREAVAPELNTSPLPVFALPTDPQTQPPTFHANKPSAPDRKRFAPQQAEATVANLPIHCIAANGHIRTHVAIANSLSRTIPPTLESQNFKQVSNTDGGAEGLAPVQLAKLQGANAPQDPTDNIHEASSDLEVNLLGTHSNLVTLNNDASVVNPTYGIPEPRAKVTDMPDGTTTSEHICSVESQKVPEAAEVQDSVQPPPLLAFTNPIHFLQLGPPSPPTARHPCRQQAVFHGPQWQQQQQTVNTKTNAGLTSAPVVMPGVAESPGKFRKGLEKPMVETSPAVVQRKEGLAKHPPLEKSSSCPNKNAIRPDTKELESNSKKQDVLLKLRAKSKDWHRQGLRKVSIPTDNALAEAIASLVPSKEEVPAYKEKREHSEFVTYGEKKPAETLENVKRRCSKLIHSSELLYQKYSDDALNKAIQSQKRAGSVPEELDPPNSPRLRRKVLHSQDSYLHRLSVSSTSSLWQDIPMVRGSTMLLSMTHEEQKLQEAKFELIASEASYLRSLNVAVDHFQCSQVLQAVLNNQEKQWLFSRLPDVRDVSNNFLFDLEEKLEENMFNFNVCDVALRHAPEFRRVYLPYVTNQTYQQQTFRRLL